MTFIKLGAVRAFPGAVPDKAQALKVLEEAAEVVEAFKRADPGNVLPVARQFPDCNKRSRSSTRSPTPCRRAATSPPRWA